MPRRKRVEPEPPARIAYTIDYRGDNDDKLTFVFLSPLEKPLFEMFEILCMGGYIMRRCTVEHEHAFAWRNGKAYWRWVFTPIDYHPEILSLDAVCDFIDRHIGKQGHEIKFYKDINKFLNL